MRIWIWLGLSLALWVQAAAGTLRDLDSYIENVRQETRVPGVAIGLVKDQEVIYSRGFGLRNVEQNLPVTQDTLFAIGSTTKAMTATVLAMLVAEGRLEWARPIRDDVADFRLWDEYATSRANLIDLLAHRTGLPGHDLAWYGRDEQPREFFWNILRFLEPSTSFREKWQYNNFMYMAAGVIAEKVSGQPWESLVRERIFKPLKMTHSNFTVLEMESSSDHSKPYVFLEQSAQRVPMRPIVGMGPAGSVNSSVREMGEWLKFNLAKGKWGEGNLVPKEQFATLWGAHMAIPEPTLPFPEFSHATYGLGWIRQTYRGQDLIWHTGGIDGFSAFVGLLPQKNVGVVVLQNAGSKGAMMISAALRALDEATAMAPVDWYARFKELAARRDSTSEPEKPDLREAPPRALSDYSGVFVHPAYGEVKISVSGARLSLDFNGLAFHLEHRTSGTFDLQSDDIRLQKDLAGFEPVVFQVDPRGLISEVQLRLEPTVDAIRFRRRN